MTVRYTDVPAGDGFQIAYLFMDDLLVFSATALYLGCVFRGACGISRLWAAASAFLTVFIFFELLLVYRAVLVLIGFALT
jgi:hypothetical protein